MSTQTPLFDRSFYLESNPDVAAAGIDPFAHFTASGVTEGRSPASWFDFAFYKQNYTDLASFTNAQLWAHFVNFGVNEGRIPSQSLENFSPTSYLLVNPDVAAAGVGALFHYLAFGMDEGRGGALPPGGEQGTLLFDAEYYLAANPDVAAAGLDPYTHFLNFGLDEGRSPAEWFDADYYRESNEGLSELSSADLWQHFVSVGLDDGLAPNAEFERFNAESYLEVNPDVAAAGLNPLLHYLQFGIDESREGAFPNTAPTVTVPATLSATEDLGANFTVTTADIDGDELTVTATAANGTVARNLDGSYTYTGNANFFGEDTITVTVNDGQGGQTQQTIAVAVSSVNDAPTVTVPATLSATEDLGANFTVTPADVDGDELTVTATADNGTVTDNGDGTYTYTGNANFFGEDTITVTVDDGNEVVTETIVVTVAAANDAPTVTVPSTLSATEDLGANFTVTTADIDGDELTVTATAANGTVARNLDGSYTYTGNANFFGEDTITVTVDDGTEQVSETILVTVAPVQDAPSLSVPQTLLATEDVGQVFSIAASDVDGDAITVTTTAANGTVARNLDGSYTYTGNPNFFGEDTITVTVDDGTEQVTETISVTVNPVQDFNMFARSDSDAAPNLVDENATVGTTVGLTVWATDGDDFVPGVSTVTYRMVADQFGSPYTAGEFQVDAVTGVVSVAGSLDHELGATRTILVEARSADGSTAIQTFVINLNDLDEADPVITSATVATAIDENVGPDTAVYTVVSTDTGDISGGVTYSLGEDADSGRFAINPSNGVVTLIDSPDFETQSSYTFTVVATDAAGNSTSQQVTLAVNDLDEEDPVFTSSTTATAIAENSGANQVVYTAVATDDSGADGVRFSLGEDGDGDAFTIDAVTGEVTLVGNPNHENKASYSFTVVATDEEGNSTSQAVTLAINDRDEASPVFTSSGEDSADENQSLLYTASADDDLDVDNAAPGSVTYSLKAGVGDASVLTIDEETGEVTLASGALNREAKSSYTFTVVATDASGNAVEQEVFINVNDLDEFNVAFASPADANVATNTVTENALVGTTVGVTAQAADADATNSTVTYSLVANANGDPYVAGEFAINSTTGVITVAGAIDREAPAGGERTVFVRATSSDGSTSIQSFTIAVQGVDEAPITFFPDANTSANTVNENATAGTLVGVTARAEDGDAGTTITYSLVADGQGNPYTAGLFQINPTTGVVSVLGNLDHETQTSHIIIVKAESSDGDIAFRQFTINVNDLDDAAPTITSPLTATAINENSGAGQAVYTATATDTDDISAGVTFSLGEDADSNLFTINSSTGVVTLTGNPNHEAKSSYTFTVVATDAAGNSDSQQVSLLINDRDEAAPVFSSLASSTANENQRLLYTATAVDALDIDNPASGTLTYSLKPGVGDQAALEIDASTGAVSLASGQLDQETKSSYTFTVVATDASGNATEHAVSISVNDLDESAPTVTSSGEDSVMENSGAGQVVYTVTATDTGDIGSGLTYSIEGEDASFFTINSTTGAVTLTANPNAEARSSYSFTVRATDGAGQSDSQLVFLTVDNVDEFPILFSDDNSNVVEVNAGQAAGTAIGVDVNATDADSGTSITYSLVTDITGTVAYTAGEFAVDSGTGIVSTGSTPIVFDASTPANNNRTLYIKAVSSDGSVAIQTYDVTITAPNTDIGGNPGTSALSFDFGNGDRNGDGVINVSDSADDDELFDDVVANPAGSALNVRIGDRIRGLTEIDEFVPGVTQLSIPDTFDSFGNDRVDDQQFEVYYGTYTNVDGVMTFTVTSTPGTTADPTSATHTMILYDNDPSEFVGFVEGLVFTGVFAEEQWFISDGFTSNAKLNYQPLPGDTSEENVIYGTSAAEVINSGSGIDIIYAGGGNDRLYGGEDAGTSDWLFGGAGQDQFFISGSTFGGVDVVKDFNADEDVIRMTPEESGVTANFADGDTMSWFNPSQIITRGMTEGETLNDALADELGLAGGVGNVYLFEYEGKDYLVWDAYNNGWSGGADDVAVEITGYTGTLTPNDILLYGIT